jgi:hypothetical protein
LAAGLRKEEDTERRLASFRAVYKPYLEVLSNYLLLPLPGWLPDQSLRDDWQQGIESTAAVGPFERGLESPPLAGGADDDL